MYVPFVTSRLERRKGGGGGGKSGGGSSSGGKSSGSSGSTSSSGSKGSTGSTSSSGSGGSSAPSRSSSVSTSSGAKTASSFSNGGGPTVSIPSGSLFAGRTEGGATRSQVYGSSIYGSGYPGITGRGVTNRNFPFYFWPLAWGAAGGSAVATAAYLHDTEYGLPDNTSRPGGPMVFATFASNSANTTFRLVADNDTVSDLIPDIDASCGSSLNNATSTTTPTPFNDTDPNSPQPESAIQYYRASSVALTLDGYNNSEATGPDGTPNTPLPSNIDMNLLNCLNQTIGTAVPLIDGASAQWPTPQVSLLALISTIWWLLFA